MPVAGRGLSSSESSSEDITPSGRSDITPYRGSIIPPRSPYSSSNGSLARTPEEDEEDADEEEEEDDEDEEGTRGVLRRRLLKEPNDAAESSDVDMSAGMYSSSLSRGLASRRGGGTGELTRAMRGRLLPIYERVNRYVTPEYIKVRGC
jgi:hypothetical protein